MVKIGNIELGEFPLLLAPMEDVSDPPFRFVCKQNGVDMMYTEFISSEGLIRDAAKSKAKLDIFEYERPIGIQIFGSNIESMREATEIATQANPDLIDINYGCPVKNVACRGAGASLLQDIDKMVKMTEAVVKATHLPVTVKTRLGWDDNTKNVVEVAERLQDVGISPDNGNSKCNTSSNERIGRDLIRNITAKNQFGKAASSGGGTYYHHYPGNKLPCEDQKMVVHRKKCDENCINNPIPCSPG